MSLDDWSHTPGPPAPIIRAQLAKVLESRSFSRAQSLGQLLRYLVEETVSGRSGSLKEITIGVGALGRSDSFDPDADPIVRVQARRLRQKLEQYYEREGAADAILIVLPKGGYIPQFLERTAGAPATPPTRRKIIAYAASGIAGVAASAWLIRNVSGTSDKNKALRAYTSI